MKIILALSFLFSPFGIAQEFTKAIEDNSYFIEEAYNQEDHVVQHIFNAVRSQTGSSLGASFTQEWPIFGQTHQFSFTLPYFFDPLNSPKQEGVGDIMLNYRYQLVNENNLAVSPRISLILPTGNESKGFGDGVVGAQINLPVSKRFSNEIVTHYNAGFTILPNVQFTTSKATITEYFVGASGIYLANKSFNVMAEVLYTSSGSTFGSTNELIISPGMRWAIDIGELQIIPGLAFPFYFNSGRQENASFLYLSFEHSY
ncbi:MAG: transporter [Bacteroidota bacterium]|nr:transporter [Bacteroidota bacterium]